VLLVAVVTAGCVPLQPSPPGGASSRRPELRLTALAGGRFRFQPEALRAPAGTPVRLVYTNADAVPHDFVLDGEATAHIAVLPGRTAAIEFAAPTRPGTYAFYCSIAGHREAGMTGQLVVVPVGGA